MKALASALVAAQKEMPRVERTGVNPHFGSKFVTLDHLISKTRPVLAKHGLSIVQQLDTSDTGAPALTTTLLHESGELLASTLPLPLVTDMQKLGAAITYGRRYAWASVLAICDEDDDDGNSVSEVGVASQGAAGGAAPKSPPKPDGGHIPSPPPSGTPNSDGWTLPFGKHKGRTIAEIDADAPEYLDWILEKTDKEDIKDRIRAFRLESELVEVGGELVDEDIPF